MSLAAKVELALLQRNCREKNYPDTIVSFLHLQNRFAFSLEEYIKELGEREKNQVTLLYVCNKSSLDNNQIPFLYQQSSCGHWQTIADYVNSFWENFLNTVLLCWCSGQGKEKKIYNLFHK